MFFEYTYICCTLCKTQLILLFLFFFSWNSVVILCFYLLHMGATTILSRVSKPRESQSVSSPTTFELYTEVRVKASYAFSSNPKKPLLLMCCLIACIPTPTDEAVIDFTTRRAQHNNSCLRCAAQTSKNHAEVELRETDRPTPRKERLFVCSFTTGNICK